MKPLINLPTLKNQTNQQLFILAHYYLWIKDKHFQPIELILFTVRSSLIIHFLRDPAEAGPPDHIWPVRLQLSGLSALSL